MIEELFPIELIKLFAGRFNMNGVYEIRVRVNKPIYINYYGDYIPLKDTTQAVVYADLKLIDHIISKATEMSVYRFNSQIKQGFITTVEGVRIGLSGELVENDNGEIQTIKNPTSLVIRIPHEIKGCASEIMSHIEDLYGVKNTLIISPPGCGKTTIIRDIARLLSLKNKIYNTLIVDERYEIAGNINQNSRLDVGFTSDVLSGGNKAFAFSSGIRALKPDVIITDEIGSREDCVAIMNATNSGVKVIATAHAREKKEILYRPTFKELFKVNVFERIIVLSQREGMGTIEEVLDKNFLPVKSLSW